MLLEAAVIRLLPSGGLLVVVLRCVGSVGGFYVVADVVEIAVYVCGGFVR